VLVPLVIIIVMGVIGVLDAGPGMADQASSDTIAAIINYMINNLPGMVISAIAGAVVGFLVTAIKKVTPKKVQRKVKRGLHVRLADKR